MEHLCMGALGGFLYVGVELLFRRRSHISMFFLGGLSFWAVGMLDRAAPGLPLAAQAVLGAALITALELLFGCALNLGLGLGVWDYSDCPCNLHGQICLPFSLCWTALSLAAVFADDALRYLLFGEAPPLYRWL